MSNSSKKTDLLVIGGGPGGYAAAFRGSDLGMGVILVEADSRLGGTCLLRGCIPSKALLHVAQFMSESREAEAWGLKFQEPTIDLEKMRSWKEGIVAQFSKGLSGLSRKRKVEVVTGRATFKDSGTVIVEGEGDLKEIQFEHAIVATGSRPSTLPVFDINSPNILNSTTALALEGIPERLLAVGGGIIGLELSTVYAELGSKVTLIEVTDGLVPGADRDLIRPLQKRIESRVDSLHLNTSVAAVTQEQGGLSVVFEGEIENKHQVFDKILLSVGRRPNSENLGLEKTGVELTPRGHIQVDHQMRTGEQNVFAIGDVVEGPGLAHKASHEGKVAAETIAGQPASFDGIIPSVVYTNPEVAWCGLTETQAEKDGRSIEVARFPWAASGRAATLGNQDGLTKLMIDPETDRILGVGIVGPNAGELISEGVVAIEMASVAEDLAQCIHPHPSLSESIGVAAEIHMGSATDLYIPKRK